MNTTGMTHFTVMGFGHCLTRSGFTHLEVFRFFIPCIFYALQ